MALVLGDNFSYQGAKPLDGRIKYDSVSTMKAVADATMYDGCLAYCSGTDKTYQWKSTNTVDEILGKWREFSSGGSGTSDYTDLTNKPSINSVTLSGNKTTSDLGLQAEMQLSTMPAAGESYLGKTVQYVGATGNGYTHNYFYECVSDGESTPTYSWQQSNVQPSSGGGGGHTIEDSEGTDLTQRDTLQFGEGFTASDDSTNEKTVITPDVMQSGDMDDVLTPLPSVQPRYHKYSTTEQVVGEWIDGNTLYERIIQTTTPNRSNADTLIYTFDDADIITNILGYVVDTSISSQKGSIPINIYYSSSAYVAVFAGDGTDTSKRALYCRCNGWINSPAVITVQYTKSTT